MRCRGGCVSHLLHGVDDQGIHAGFGLTLDTTRVCLLLASAGVDAVELALVGAFGGEPPHGDHQRPDRHDGDEREDHERPTCRPVSVTTWPSCMIVSVLR